jgi:transcriptional regulator with XRE-family HTH domain
MEVVMSFAARLKSLRMKSGKSLQDVADAVGVSKGHLWDLESGNSKNPSAELLTKLSGFFGVSVATLAGEAPGDQTAEEMKIMFRRLQGLDDKTLKLVKAMLEESERQQLQDKDKGDGD